MLPTTTPRDKPRNQAPLQPMGWRVNAYVNATRQSQQEAERQRQRADRLAARNRRLLAWEALLAAGALGVAGALLCLGLVLGYAAGVGLIGMVSR